MVDLKVTDGGDLVVDESGDLSLVSGDEYVIQAILFRLKTVRGDFVLFPPFGTDLEAFIGLPNDEITRARIQMEVEHSLSRDLIAGAADVRVAAVNRNEVLVVIEMPSVEDPGRNVQVTVGLDLREGLVFARGGIRS